MVIVHHVSIFIVHNIIYIIIMLPGGRGHDWTSVYGCHFMSLQTWQ
jgi:hypothetical protein